MTFLQNNPEDLTPEQISNLVEELTSTGVTTATDPDIADHMSAFDETALDDEDAQFSLIDLVYDQLTLDDEGEVL